LAAFAQLAFGAATADALGPHRHPSRRARGPAADCQPYGSAACLLPFPDDRFTRPDSSTATGVRVSLPAAAMPQNRAGERIGVAEYDRNDGFSPGSTVIAHVPGLDNAAAFLKTAPVGLADMSQAFAPTQPVVVLDERTGARQLIFCELDATANSPQTTNLLIHPAAGLIEGRTYAVALRNLRAANGRPLAAPGWFARLRDARSLYPALHPQRERYRRIFAALSRAGIPRRGLFEAWDFTVASSRSLTARLLAIRDNAFAQLGDYELGDAHVDGQPPVFTVTSSDALTPRLRRVQGTFQVPCYLIACGPDGGAGFHYGSANPDAVPTQVAGNVATASFGRV